MPDDSSRCGLRTSSDAVACLSCWIRRTGTTEPAAKAFCFRGSLALDACCLGRRFKNRALVFSQHCGLVDRSMVMELPPRATHLDEPSGCTNPKFKPNSGSFAQAFFTSHEEVIVIVTLRREIVERHADSRWPAKQLRIALPDGRPSAPDTTNRIVHAGSLPVRPVGTERFQIGGVEGPVKIDQCVQRAAITCGRFSSRYFGCAVFRELCFPHHSSVTRRWC